MSKQALLPTWLVVLTGVIVVALIVGGSALQRSQASRLQAAWHDQLLSIAELKVQQITTWREEHLARAAILSGGTFFTEGLAEWLEQRDVETADKVLVRLRAMQAEYGYADVQLLDRDGRIVLSLEGATGEPVPEALEALSVALATGRPAMTELHMDQHERTPHVGVIAPVYLATSDSDPIAAVLLRIDASQFLYPMIQSWPVPSTSAETLLVRREGDAVLFLNELRHRPGTALQLRVPLSQGTLPAAMGIAGVTGTVEGRDYRGVPVLAAIRPVPGASWVMVAKVDRVEVLAASSLTSGLILGLTGVLVVAALATVGLVWQRGSKAHYRSLYEAERATSIERERAQRYLDIANVMILALDAQWQVTLINRKGCEMLGRTEDEILGRNWVEHFVPASARAELLTKLGVIAAGADWQHAYNENPLLRADGTERLIAWQNTVLKDDTGHVTGILTCGTDITEQRAAERALEEQEEQLRTTLYAIGDGVIATDSTGCVQRMNPVAEALTGWTEAEARGRPLHEAFRIVNELTMREAENPVTRVLREGVVVGLANHTMLVARDGVERPIHDSAAPIRGQDGSLYGVVLVFRDQTEERRYIAALQESEERYRTVAHFTHQWEYWLAPDGSLPYMSPSVERITGYPAEAFVRDPGLLRQIVHPDDLLRSEQHRPAQAQRRDGAAAHQVEYRIHRRDGAVRWISHTCVAIHRADGTFLGMRASNHDITERKAAEEALARERALLRTVIDNLPDAIYAKDSQARKILANAADVANCGANDEAQVLGKTDCELFPQEIADRFYEEDLRVLETGEPLLGQEVLIPDRAGRPLWWQSSKVPLRDQDGRVAGIVGIARNVTEQKRAEAEREALLAQVRAQAKQVQQIIDTVPQGVVLLDCGGKVLQANPAAQGALMALAGASLGDTLTHLGGRPLLELLTSPPRGLWHELHAGDRTYQMVARSIERGATVQGWVLAIEDATRERQILDELQQQERLAAVGHLAAGIAHDLNNILAVVVLYTQMAQTLEDVPAEVRGWMGTVNEEVHHATRLIQQVLDFSRRAMLERQQLDLLPLLKEQAHLLTRTLPEHIEIVLDYVPGEYTVHADPTRMRQMLMNLAVNARDAMPEGGTLRLGLARVVVGGEGEEGPGGPGSGEWIRVTVADSGSGMSPEVMAHLYEPFFTTKEPGKGTGLGLAQVYGIVGQHEGRIEVETKVGQGTQFTIYLPAAAEEGDESGTVRLDGLPRGHGEVVLVVEDNGVVREALLATLAHLGYATVAAPNGREALELLKPGNERIDVVLSDVVMPVAGGIALLQALRAQGNEIPVILLTGHTLNQEVGELWEQGLSGWLAKPPTPEQLAAALAAALRSRRLS